MVQACVCHFLQAGNMAFFSRKKKNPGWLAIGFQTDAVCAAHVRRVTDARPVVEWAASFPANRNALAEALVRVERERSTAAHDCTTLLSFGEYQMLSMDAPAVQPEELKSAVRWRLREMLDYHADDATIDVLSVPAEKGMAARNSTLFAIAARNAVIQQRQALFDDAKASLRVIDIPEMAQRNMAALLEPERTSLALLSINADGALVTVTHDDELYFARQIDVTAEQLLHGDAHAVASHHERIALELQRSIDHFDRQHHSIPVSRLALAPLGGDPSGLQEYLKANMYIPVSTLDLASILDFSATPHLRDARAQQQFFLVLGAALRLEEKAL